MAKKHDICNVERAGSLDNRFRKIVHNPRKILGKFVKKGMKVLDVGCGPGVFSIEIARIVGDSGKVIAADLQEEMLEIVRDKIKKTELEKIITLHKCKKNKIGIREKVDFVLAFYVLHELPNQKTFFEEIKRILKPKSKLLIIEPMFHVPKQDFEETVKTAEKAGFKPVGKIRVLLSRSLLLEKA